MPTVEERVHAIEDREAIRELVANYRRGLDGRHEERFMSVFHDDARWNVGGRIR